MHAHARAPPSDGPELTVLISRTRASRRPGSAVRGPRVRGGFAGGCVVCLEDPSASRQHPASALATLDRKPTVGPTMSYRGKKPGGVKSPSSKESSLISSSDPKSCEPDGVSCNVAHALTAPIRPEPGVQCRKLRTLAS